VSLRLVKIVFEQDPDASEKYLEGVEELADRLAEYKRGGFEFMCVRAVAEVRIEGIDQVLTGAGAYAIESDSEDEYLEEIATEEWKSLRNVLKAVGVPTTELPLEVDRKWVEWRL
jgi:hypothetical protein